MESRDTERRSRSPYRLIAWIEPATHHLRADVWIEQPPAPRFYLHRGFLIRQIEADGKAAPFHLNHSAASLPYVEGATEVVVDVPNVQTLHVKYGGEMTDVVLGVNMITADLVELALYSAWYPTFALGPAFDFDLEVDLPSGFLTSTNGHLREQRDQDGRSITVWTSYQSGSDIVLLASPHLQRVAGGDDGGRVEAYSRRLPAALLQRKIDDLVAGLDRLTGLYGPPRVHGILRLVYSPRGGWGYARIPLIVVSEERAEGVLSQELGEARDFRDNAHELAHFWWSIADPSTPDDWINEGLAEYTAFRLTEERFGPAFAKLRLAEYRQNACQSKTSDCIADTKSSSPDREINRYDKATLMFLEARRRFGREPLDALLKALYTRFGRTGQATTARFLEEAEKHLGREAQRFFREELHRRPTVDGCDRTPRLAYDQATDRGDSGSWKLPRLN